MRTSAMLFSKMIANSNTRVGTLLPARLSLFRTPVRHIQTQACIRTFDFKYHAKKMGTKITFTAQPEKNETLTEFKKQVNAKLNSLLFENKFENHELLMASSTQFAKPDETLKNAVAKFGVEYLKFIGFPLDVSRSIMTGHCLLSHLNKDAHEENTYSLRPDTTKPTLYSAVTAPDARLPKLMTQGKTVVRRAVHTDIKYEINKWAEDAFYAWHVYASQPVCALNMVLTPLEHHKTEKYLDCFKFFKSVHDRYALTDHYHPTTGETEGDIVADQNCTSLYKFLAEIRKINLKCLLGDNPTPQLLMRILSNVYFSEVEQDSDLLSLTYKR